MPTRTLWAVIAAGASFAAASAIMVWTMRPPLRALDYFLSGAVGTFVALLALFLTLVDPGRWAGFFYTKRKKIETAPAPEKKRSTLGI